MLGSNEAARVSASKVLIDALSEGQGSCAPCAANDAVDMAELRAKLDGLIGRDAESRAAEITKDLEQRLETVTAEQTPRPPTAGPEAPPPDT